MALAVVRYQRISCSTGDRLASRVRMGEKFDEHWIRFLGGTVGGNDQLHFVPSTREARGEEYLLLLLAADAHDDIGQAKLHSHFRFEQRLSLLRDAEPS